MPPSAAPSYVFATEEDVVAILSADGLAGRLDDDASGSASAAETAYLTKAIRWASARIGLYASSYSAAELSRSWWTNWACSVIAAHMVCCRRGNPPAGSLAEAYDEVLEELRQVQTGALVIPDAAFRDSGLPWWGHTSLSYYHRVRKLRTVRALSSRQGDRSGQTIDFAAEIIAPGEQGY